MHNTPAIPPRLIDATIARSWLLVNGTRTDLFDRADQSGADQIILDIEDAVDPKLKPSARHDVATWLQNKSAWVRINDRTTPFWSDDVDHLKGLPGLVGVMLAKTESAEHITETFDRLGGTTPVLALIESALGIEEAPTIARARGALRLAFAAAITDATPAPAPTIWRWPIRDPGSWSPAASAISPAPLTVPQSATVTASCAIKPR
jgi:citrate lyase subunit beta / citryl-CoA lyase